MSKRILILSSSPRKNGNSDILCDEFMRGAIESGNSVEKIRIPDKAIGFCRACNACLTTGECVIKDDMQSVLQKIIDADVIVLASPVYFYSVSAQIKTLIDRTYARAREVNNKEFYYILTAADAELEATKTAVECFRGYVSCLPGSKEKGIIYGIGVLKRGDVKGTDKMSEAYEMGKNIK